MVRRGVAASFVLIACTAQITSWDTVILGESVSLSTGILALAALIWLVRDPGWGRAGLFAAGLDREPSASAGESAGADVIHGAEWTTHSN